MDGWMDDHRPDVSKNNRRKKEKKTKPTHQNFCALDIIFFFFFFFSFHKDILSYKATRTQIPRQKRLLSKTHAHLVGGRQWPGHRGFEGPRGLSTRGGTWNPSSQRARRMVETRGTVFAQSLCLFGLCNYFLAVIKEESPL